MTKNTINYQKILLWTPPLLLVIQETQKRIVSFVEFGFSNTYHDNLKPLLHYGREALNFIMVRM